MSWDDDFDDDEHRARRPDGSRPSGWSIAGRAAGYAGIVVGVGALVVGAVVAVNLVGTAADPDGFAAPAAYGSHVPMPPTTTTEAEAELPEGTPLADGGSDGGSDGGGDGATPDESSGLTVDEQAPIEVVDAEWSARLADATGIPERAISAYALAHVLIAGEEPECGIDWTTIAAIGSIESGHGSHGSATLDEYGNAEPAIIGRALDGDGVAKIADTDDGTLDGDATWDRAVGPMQFIPSTWAKWGSDANGDGAADPHQIDDAALSTARYLCAAGPMMTPEQWRAAVFSYNHDNDYVDQVATLAQKYAKAVE